MKSQSKRGATGAKRAAMTLAYPVGFRLRIVKLFLEEGCRAGLLVEQFGISTHSIQRWVRAYRLHGTSGLEVKRPVSRKSRVADEVWQQAVVIQLNLGKDQTEGWLVWAVLLLIQALPSAAFLLVSLFSVMPEGIRPTGFFNRSRPQPVRISN